MPIASTTPPQKKKGAARPVRHNLRTASRVGAYPEPVGPHPADQLVQFAQQQDKPATDCSVSTADLLSEFLNFRGLLTSILEDRRDRAHPCPEKIDLGEQFKGRVCPNNQPPPPSLHETICSLHGALSRHIEVLNELEEKLAGVLLPTLPMPPDEAGPLKDSHPVPSSVGGVLEAIERLNAYTSKLLDLIKRAAV
jgi:hypothetical protein